MDELVSVLNLTHKPRMQSQRTKNAESEDHICALRYLRSLGDGAGAIKAFEFQALIAYNLWHRSLFWELLPR